MPREISRNHIDKVADAWDPSGPGLWFCNWRIWVDAKRRLEEAIAPLGLRAREFWLLSLAGGDFSQQHIADLCGLDPSTLVPWLDALEERGWLRRERNPRDRRVQLLRRTEAGDQLFQRALPRAQRAEAEHLSVLSEAHQRQLVEAMRKLITDHK